ncbi:MAG: T9SS type A sorting domain-containing protein [Chitinophagales bacterium]
MKKILLILLIALGLLLPDLVKGQTVIAGDTARATIPANTTDSVIKAPAAVTNINNTENEIILYPNPARDELNVVYSPNADVKTIAVYNIIGKVIAVYKVTSAGANLNLENIPSGIYFVRLTNSHGDVVVTRKFTKQ